MEFSVSGMPENTVRQFNVKYAIAYPSKLVDYFKETIDDYNNDETYEHVKIFLRGKVMFEGKIEEWNVKPFLENLKKGDKIYIEY